MFFKEEKNNNENFILNNNFISNDLKTSNLIQSIKSFNLNIKNEFNLKSGEFFFISFDEIIYLIIETLKFHLKLIENDSKNYENILQNFLLFLRNKIINFLKEKNNKNFDLEKISYKNIIEKLKEKTQLNTEINNNNNSSILNKKNKIFSTKNKKNSNQTIKKNFSQKNLKNQSKFNNNFTPKKKINLPVKKIFQYFQINNPPLTNRKENKSKHYFKFKKYIHNENLNKISAKKLENLFNNSYSNSENKNNIFNLKTNKSFSRKPKPSSLTNLYMQNGLNLVYEYKKIENKEKNFGCF